jgi:hypothetical protein
VAFGDDDDGDDDHRFGIKIHAERCEMYTSIYVCFANKFIIMECISARNYEFY